MKYETAKKLKDAGYPQRVEEVNKYILPDNSTIDLERLTLLDYPEACYLPSLEELIEACGDTFLSLQKIDNFWSTVSQGEDHDCVGDNPIEAVANMWLQIHPNEAKE